MKIECSIHRCDKPSFCRTWCQMHYNRWYRTGNPIARRHHKVDGLILTPPYTRNPVVVGNGE